MATHSVKEANAQMQSVVTVKGGNQESMEKTTAVNDIVQMVDAKLRAAYERFVATPTQEMAEPLFWWDIYALGPIQYGPGLLPPAPFTGPLLPNQIIRAGESAYVVTVLLLSTTFPSPVLSAADLLSNFALPYKVEYNTGELKHWQPGPANLQHVGGGTLTPGVPWAIDVFEFTAQDEGLYEMNINARIYGCNGVTAPPFSAYAHIVFDIDSDIFNTHPRTQVDIPIRFQVYR